MTYSHTQVGSLHFPEISFILELCCKVFYEEKSGKNLKIILRIFNGAYLQKNLSGYYSYFSVIDQLSQQVKI